MVTSIHRYPVKSMGGERLSESMLTLQGLPGDRTFAFVLADSKISFPWFTARDYPELLQHITRTVPGSPPSVEVETPGGERFAANDPALLALLEAASGKRLTLLHDYRGSYDVAPVTLISHATVGTLATAAGVAPDAGRFRMSITVDTGSAEPFTENAWVGRLVRIGEARIAVTEPDRRCAMITLAHPGSEASPAVLKAAAELNNACAGVYGAVFVAGMIREGDEITLE
ncbi:MAG: MOSC N-terminal beta barrel domain-containing protein [Dehalococcoidia bacterium]